MNFDILNDLFSQLIDKRGRLSGEKIRLNADIVDKINDIDFLTVVYRRTPSPLS